MKKYNKHYIVAFDYGWIFGIQSPFENKFDEVMGFMKQFENWWYYLPGIYIFKSNKSSKKIADTIIKKFDDVRFLIIKVSVKDFNGRLPEDAWTWIAKEGKVKIKKFSTKTKTLYFNHIFDTNGFAISKELIEGANKDYEPTKTHSCLRHGYWCWKNFFERPLDIVLYLKSKK